MQNETPTTSFIMLAGKHLLICHARRNPRQRRTMDYCPRRLDKQPERFQVFVSGDNRYKLYVNKQLVSIGPARSDLRHWNYATVDLAPYLRTGNNIVAAVSQHLVHHRFLPARFRRTNLSHQHRQHVEMYPRHRLLSCSRANAWLLCSRTRRTFRRA